MVMDNKAQLHTLEGLGAAVLITFTVLAISQNTMMVTPQNELAVNVQLEQMSCDALALLDTAGHESVEYNLTECIAGWDMTEARYPSGNLQTLDKSLSYLLPDVLYNIEIAYFKHGTLTVKDLVINGPPADNAVVSRRFVTLTNETVQNAGGKWDLEDDELKVIEVRMTTWKV